MKIKLNPFANLDPVSKEFLKICLKWNAISLLLGLIAGLLQ